MTNESQREGAPVPIVETAAGTTSPDNSRTGNAAYIVTAVVVALMLVFGLLMSSCMRMFSDIVEEESGYYEYYGGDEYWDQDRDEEWDENMDVETEDDDGLWDVYGVDDDGTFIPVQDVMYSDLAMRNVTLDSLIPASTYANSNPTVSSFVRELVVYDRDAVADLTEPLRAGSWGQMEVSESLEQAIGVADQAIADIRALELPTTEGDNASEISRDLETGRTQVVRRWEAIKDVLVLLSESDEVRREALLDADDKVIETTQEAADSLSEALTVSAKR